jgi:hypothetical protein
MYFGYGGAARLPKRKLDMLFLLRDCALKAPKSNGLGMLRDGSRELYL